MYYRSDCTHACEKRTKKPTLFPYKPFLERWLGLRRRPTKSVLSAWPNSTLHKQITGILVLVEYAVVQRFGDTGQAVELDMDIAVLLLIGSVHSEEKFNVLHSSAYKVGVERALHEYILKLQMFNSVRWVSLI